MRISLRGAIYIYIYTWKPSLTSWAHGDTICLRPLQVDNIFAFIRQVAVLLRHNNIFVFVVFESRVTWANSVPILVFLGLSVLELGPMYATDRQTSDRRQTKASINASALRRRRNNKYQLETKASSHAGQCIPAGSSVSLPRMVLITVSIITMRSVSRKLCVRLFTLCKISTAIFRILWRHLQMDLRNV